MSASRVNNHSTVTKATTRKKPSSLCGEVVNNTTGSSLLQSDTLVATFTTINIEGCPFSCEMDQATHTAGGEEWIGMNGPTFCSLQLPSTNEIRRGDRRNVVGSKLRCAHRQADASPSPFHRLKAPRPSILSRSFTAAFPSDCFTVNAMRIIISTQDYLVHLNSSER
jgi:hypothetical protein